MESTRLSHSNRVALFLDFNFDAKSIVQCFSEIHKRCYTNFIQERNKPMCHNFQTFYFIFQLMSHFSLNSSSSPSPVAHSSLECCHFHNMLIVTIFSIKQPFLTINGSNTLYGQMTKTFPLTQHTLEEFQGRLVNV